MVKVVFQGLGEIGKRTAKLLMQQKGVCVVGAFDPEYTGDDIGGVLGLDSTGIVVEENLARMYVTTEPDVVVIATSSSLEEMQSQIEQAVYAGVNVVTPAEELFFPDEINHEISADLDDLAKQHDVRVLGTGLNPGCLMDMYPIHAIGCRKEDVKRLSIYRYTNTIDRRDALLEKTGVGLTLDQFTDRQDKDKLGHVGLELSAAYVADALGLENYELDFSRVPQLATEMITTRSGITILEHQVAGILEFCSVYVDGHERIALALKMFVGCYERNGFKANYGGKDELIANYDPMICGDEATAVILAGAVKLPEILTGKPGLNTVTYVPNPNIMLKE